jgi:hypothetical protein
MSIFGSITGGYDRSETDFKRETDLWNRQQKKTSKKLYKGVLTPGFRDYESIYSGQPTDIERTALGQLQTYGQQQPAYMEQAGGALFRTAHLKIFCPRQ